MANVFTAVPGHRPPPPVGAAKRLLPIADIFVRSLVSRPATGTLATTWVTPATLGLSAAGVVASLLVVAALVVGQWPGPLVVVVSVLALCFGLGAGSAVVVGVGQRRRTRAAGR